MLERRTEYICMKAVNVPRPMLCLSMSYHNKTQISAERDGSLRFTFPEELWAADLKNTQKQLDFSFYNCTRTSQLQ